MKKFKNVYKNPISTKDGLVLPGKTGMLPDNCIEPLLKAKKIELVERKDVGENKPRESDAESSMGYKRSDVEKNVQGGRRKTVSQAGTDKSTSNTKPKQTVKKRTTTKRPVIRKTSSVDSNGRLDKPNKEIP